MKKLKYNISLFLAGVCLSLAGCQSIDEPAPLTPSVTTGDIVEVGTDYAVFPSIDVDGECSDCYFYVSASKDMSHKEQVEENGTLSDLSHSSTYYYMACATDGENEVYGETKSFTTLISYALTIGAIDSLSVYDTAAYKFDTNNDGANDMGIYIPSYGTLPAYRSWDDDGNEQWSIDEELIVEEDTSFIVYAFYPFSDLTNEDFLYVENSETPSVAWGTSGEINHDNTSAEIDMQEMLATINVEISCEGLTVSHVVIVNEGRYIPCYGYMDITTGEFLCPSDAYHEDVVGNLVSGESSFTDYQVCSFRMLPCSFDDSLAVALYITTDSDEYVSYFEPMDWNSGHAYNYEVTISTSEIMNLEYVSDSVIDAWKNGGSSDNVDIEYE